MEAGPLAELPVVRLERLGGGGIPDDRVDARADLLHLLEVGQLEALGDARRAAVGAASRSRSSSLPMMSVQPSLHQVLGLEDAGDEVVEVVHAASLPARLRGSAAQAGSVGRLSRTSIDDGVRWNT